MLKFEWLRIFYIPLINLFRKDGNNKQIRIEHIHGKYGFADPCEFSSVPELIEYYRTRTLVEYSAALDIMLLYPICREVRMKTSNKEILGWLCITELYIKWN